VRNDPLNQVDPTGRQAVEAAVAACIGPQAAACAIGATVIVVAGGAIYCATSEQCRSDVGGFWDGVFQSEGSEGRPSDGLPVQEGATVERPGRRGSRDQIYDKPGGVDEANEDFDNSVDPDTVEDRGDGIRTGQTPNGDNITVRPTSGDGTGPPTVDVTRGNGRERDTDKFRYRPPREEEPR
jgi:hypothetical protein